MPVAVLPIPTASLTSSVVPLQAALSPQLLRPALLPVLWVVTGCLLGMVPSGLKAFWPVRSEEARAKQKLHRRVFTGCTLGAVVSLWIFSGTWAFLSVFALMAIIAQNEYFMMARENGCFPTWKLGTLGSFGMYLAACAHNPVLRDALLPLTGTVTLVYLMIRGKVEKTTPPLTMNDVSTTFMGEEPVPWAPVPLAARRVRARCASSGCYGYL